MILNEILSAINKATVRFKDRTLGGLGLSVSRWLQPPIASYDVYSGLTEVIERHAGVKVYRDNLINSRAYQMGGGFMQEKSGHHSSGKCHRAWRLERRQDFDIAVCDSQGVD